MARPAGEPASAADRLLDSSVRHQVHLQRVATTRAREAAEALREKSDAKLRKALEGRLEKVKSRGLGVNLRSQAQLRELEARARAVIREGVLAARARLAGGLEDLARTESEFSARAMERTLGGKVKVLRPTAREVKSIVRGVPMEGRLFRDWVAQAERAAVARLRAAVNLGLQAGETPAEIVARVLPSARGERRGTVLDRLESDLEVVARTAVNHTSARARMESFRANREFVKAWQFTAVLDNRTTVRCASLDGQVFPVGEGPLPPIHVNCRSSATPVLKSWRELGLVGLSAEERQELDGKPAESLTYGKWLRRQPAEVQDEILGKGKARLFRAGRVKIESFTDQRNRPLRLEELRALDREALGTST